MKSRFLFPANFKWFGLVLALFGFVLGYFVVYQDYEIRSLQWRVRENGMLQNAIENYTNELALTCVIVGLIFVAFSRLKQEDELIAKLRLDALYWAVLINYCIYFTLQIAMDVARSRGYASESKLLPDWGVYSDVYSLYNMFSPLLIFIARFYYLLYSKKDDFVIRHLHYLPNYPFKRIGILISVVSLVPILALFYVPELFGHTPPGWIGVVFYLLPVGLLLWAYSENKQEDELTAQFRLESMQIAVFINYGLLLLANFTVYSLAFLFVMGMNFVSLLLVFVIRLSYLSFRNKLRENAELRGGIYA